MVGERPAAQVAAYERGNRTGRYDRASGWPADPFHYDTARRTYSGPVSRGYRAGFAGEDAGQPAVTLVIPRGGSGSCGQCLRVIAGGETVTVLDSGACRCGDCYWPAGDYGWCSYCPNFTYHNLRHGACGECWARWTDYPEVMPPHLRSVGGAR